MSCWTVPSISDPFEGNLVHTYKTIPQCRSHGSDWRCLKDAHPFSADIRNHEMKYLDCKNVNKQTNKNPSGLESGGGGSGEVLDFPLTPQKHEKQLT